LAVQSADKENEECLKQIASFLVWVVPAQAWGDSKKVAAWIEARATPINEEQYHTPIDDRKADRT
jgi:hypothetical protein